MKNRLKIFTLLSAMIIILFSNYKIAYAGSGGSSSGTTTVSTEQGLRDALTGSKDIEIFNSTIVINSQLSISRNVTIKGAGSKSKLAFRSGVGKSCIVIEGGADVTLDTLLITGCSADATPVTRKGPLIKIRDKGKLRISGNVEAYNNHNSITTAEETKNNTSNNDDNGTIGGGITVYGNLTLNKDSKLRVHHDFSLWAGGIRFMNGSFTNYGGTCEVDNNVGYYKGGGVAITQNSITLSNFSVHDNSVTHTKTDSKGEIIDNYAGNGGGVMLAEDSTATLNNCTIYKNSANRHGGGIYLNSTSNGANINNCNIYSNEAKVHGGGICNIGSDKTVYVSGSNIYSNKATGDSSYGSGVFNSGTMEIKGNTNVGFSLYKDFKNYVGKANSGAAQICNTNKLYLYGARVFSNTGYYPIRNTGTLNYGKSDGSSGAYIRGYNGTQAINNLGTLNIYKGDIFYSGLSTGTSYGVYGGIVKIDAKDSVDIAGYSGIGASSVGNSWGTSLVAGKGCYTGINCSKLTANGNTYNLSIRGFKKGIHISKGNTADVTNARIYQNVGVGGVENLGTLDMDSCYIYNNTNTSEGSGIKNSETATLTNCYIGLSSYTDPTNYVGSKNNGTSEIYNTANGTAIIGGTVNLQNDACIQGYKGITDKTVGSSCGDASMIGGVVIGVNCESLTENDVLTRNGISAKI